RHEGHCPAITDLALRCADQRLHGSNGIAWSSVNCRSECEEGEQSKHGWSLDTVSQLDLAQSHRPWYSTTALGAINEPYLPHCFWFTVWHPDCLIEGGRSGENEIQTACDDASGGNSDVCRDACFDRRGPRRLLSRGSCGS